jgi:Zn-dependent protease with chaperone function
MARSLERKLCRQSDSPDGFRRAGFPIRGLMVLLLFLPYALMLMFIPGRWEWSAAVVLGLGAVLITLNAWAMWLIPLRWAGQLRNASPRLAAVVERTAARMGVRPRAVFELASPNANALAFMVPRFVTFTDLILNVLDDDELGAITAHELAHLDEPWWAYCTRVAMSYALVLCVAALPLVRSFGLAAGLAPLIVALVGILTLRGVGRRMELRADRCGHEHEGETAGAYARALEKIYEANLLPVVMRGKRQVHPHLYDRLIAAGASPLYDRPSPPRRAILAWIPVLLLIHVCFYTVISRGAGADPLDDPKAGREAKAPAFLPAGDQDLWAALS